MAQTLFTDSELVERAMLRASLSSADVALLWDGAADDVTAIVTGAAFLTPLSRATLRLFNCAHPDNRAATMRELREAVSEDWRPIAGFSKYEVSNLGRVRRASGGSGTSSLRVLKLVAANRGYLRVTLYADDGQMVTRQVHREVCVAFNGGPPAPGLYACHRDGNRIHNLPGNLYWGTPVENAADRARHAAERRPRKRKVSVAPAGSPVYAAPAKKVEKGRFLGRPST